MKTKQPRDPAYVLGTAALGMLVGLLLGLLAAVCALAVFNAKPSFPRLFFGGGIMGAMIGFVYPSTAWNVIEGTVHFFFGMLSAAAEEGIAPNHDAPFWLKVLFWFGAAAGIIFAVLL
jgi:hypothetical protein